MRILIMILWKVHLKKRLVYSGMLAVQAYEKTYEKCP